MMDVALVNDGPVRQSSLDLGQHCADERQVTLELEVEPAHPNRDNKQ